MLALWLVFQNKDGNAIAGIKVSSILLNEKVIFRELPFNIIVWNVSN